MQAASGELFVPAQSFCPSSARLPRVTVPKNEDFQVGLRWGTGEDQAVFRLMGLTSFPCSGFFAAPQEIKSWTSCSGEVFTPLPCCLGYWDAGMLQGWMDNSWNGRITLYVVNSQSSTEHSSSHAVGQPSGTSAVLL